MYSFQNLISGKLIKRRNRFIAEIMLDNSEIVLAHCTNTGTMKSCIEPNARVYISTSQNPERKTPYTWEMIEIGEEWVGINTAIPNKLIYHWLQNKFLPQFIQYNTIKREYTQGDSRYDIYLENEIEKCFIEIKNVTLREGNGAYFPDAITTRGLNHLKGLIELKKQGHRACMIYLIQRTDVEYFSPAKHIDLPYSTCFIEAINSGVEIFPICCKVTPEGINYHKLLSIKLD